MTPELKSVIVFVVATASVPVLEALAKLDAEAVLSDPKPWAIGLAAAAIRAAASALLGRLVERRLSPPVVPHG